MLGDKFAGSHAHLRLPRLAAFTLTNNLCGVCGGLSIWALIDAKHKESQVAEQLNGATLHAEDAIGAGAAVTAAAGITSILCFLMVGAILFKRRAPETLKTVRIKEAMFAFSACLWLGTLLPYTVIIATRSAFVTRPGVPSDTLAQIVKLSGQSLEYKDLTPPIAAMSAGWAAFFFTCVCFVLVSLEARYILKHGPDGGLLAPASAMPENQPNSRVSGSGYEGSFENKHSNTHAEKAHREHHV